MKEEQKAVETLKKIKTILDKNNINYWLDEGTLLGAVREKKLIEWDHDIDLSIWYTDLEKIRPLFNEINNTGVQAWFLEGQKHLNLVGKGYTAFASLGLRYPIPLCTRRCPSNPISSASVSTTVPE